MPKKAIVPGSEGEALRGNASGSLVQMRPYRAVAMEVLAGIKMLSLSCLTFPSPLWRINLTMTFLIRRR